MIKILAMTSSNMQPYLFTTFYPMHLRKLHMQNKILLEMNEHIIFFFQLHSVVFPFMAEVCTHKNSLYFPMDDRGRNSIHDPHSFNPPLFLLSYWIAGSRQTQWWTVRSHSLLGAIPERGVLRREHGRERAERERHLLCLNLQCPRPVGTCSIGIFQSGFMFNTLVAYPS